MPHCIQCARDFVDETALAQHVRKSSIHKSRTTLYCTICKQPFSGERALRGHSGTSDCVNHSATKGDGYLQPSPQTHARFTCDHCDMDFSIRHDLEQHAKAFHTFSCSICGEVLPDANSLMRHKDAVHTKFTFPCKTCSPPCGRSFDTQKSLDTHLRFVTEKRSLSLARHTKNKWSILQETPGTIEKLQSMTHSKEVLEKSGYRLVPHTLESISDQRKCLNCREKSFRLKSKSPINCSYHPRKPVKRYNTAKETMETYFPCCGGADGADKCVINNGHNYEDLEKLAASLIFRNTPSPCPGEPKRKAVALDCEMGTSFTNSSELIQISAVDYFSGETLIDMLVRPKVELRHYNTKYSGVTPQMMAHAVRSGEYLDGIEEAREELWRWIDSETILIGHSLNHDLLQLRLTHPLIVDSYLCVPKINASRNSLKDLTLDLLGQTVQEAKSGHDCVEDALAAREIVIWCSQNESTLEERAAISRAEEEVRRKEWEASNLEREERRRIKLESKEQERALEAEVKREPEAKKTDTAHPGQNTWVWI